MFTGDTLYVNPDHRSVTVMYSFPNYIPVSAAKVRQVANAVEPFEFRRLYGQWWDAVIPDGGKEHYIAEFNRRFQVRAPQAGSAFVPRRSRDLDLIFSLQFERTVNRDNTVSFQNLSLQIEAARWRASLAGCTV